MSITSLYVEMIIIGLETMIWMLLLIEDVVGGNVILMAAYDFSKNIGTTVLTVGIIYILGCIMDRFSDLLFYRPYQNEKKKAELSAESSLLINETAKQKETQDYIRMRMRILRATTVNIPLITGVAIWYIARNVYTLSSVILTTILGIFLSITSFYGTIDSIRKFFRNAKLIEVQNKSLNEQQYNGSKESGKEK